MRARLATSPEEWKYRSHLAYLGEAFPWVEVDDVLARLGGREAYLELIRQRQAKEERELFEKPGLLRPPKEVGDLALIGAHRFDRGPWLARAPRKPLEEALAEEVARLGVEVHARLRALGYRLHEIRRGLGREEAAICRLLQRMALDGKPEVRESTQLKLLPGEAGKWAFERPATCRSSAAWCM